MNTPHQMTTYPAIIGSLIAQARTEAGLLQEELAKKWWGVKKKKKTL